MHERDTIAAHSVTIAKWNIHRFKNQRQRAAGDNSFSQIATAMINRDYDRPEVVEAYAKHLRASYSRMQLRVSAIIAQAALKSLPKPLSPKDQRLLQDAAEVIQLGRKMGSYALATSLKEAKASRYRRYRTGTLKKSLDRAFARLKRLQLS